MTSRLIWLCALLPLTAFASPQEQLLETNKALEDSRERKEDIIAERTRLTNELQELQTELVTTAREVRKNEAALNASEEKLDILHEQLQQKNNSLVVQRSTLESLLRVALRLSQTPPEAMVMMPGNSTEIIKASRAMKMTARQVREDIHSIQDQITELGELEQKISAKHIEITQKQLMLDDKRSELQTQVAQRKNLQQALLRNEQAESKKITALTKQAESLQALIDQIEQAEREAKIKRTDRKEKLRSIAGTKGKLTLPTSGKLVQSYGDKKAGADTNKGLVFEARAQAQVVAPFDGEVVYAGNFLRYGNMVILRHQGDFHSLLAGLDKIDTSVGEFLLEGEPIGAMGKERGTNRLYYELRKNSQPIDPSPWLKKQ